MYSHGKGVRQNLTKTVELFTLAAELGLPEAQFGLGILYYNGKGVEKDPEQSLYWLKKAAEQGHPTAKNLLRKIK